MSSDHQADIIQRHHESIQRVYSLPHNTKIVEGHAKWLEHVKALSEQFPSELLSIIINMIESYQSALRISEYTIHYIEPAQRIANLYRDHPEQRTEILQQLEDVIACAIPLFERPHICKEYATQGFIHIVEILGRTQSLWDTQEIYRQGELVLPAELLNLLDVYIENLGPYRGLNYDQRESMIHEIRLQIVQKYPEDIFNLFMFAIKNEPYFHYWLSKELFFILMAQKDKRLNRPDLLQQLAQNFHLIIKKMIYAKPFILYFIFAIEKLAKANQLSLEIVKAIEPLTFESYTTQSIPRKRLLQIEEKIALITQQFRQQQANA